MRAHELQEIDRIDAGDFEGGRDMLDTKSQRAEKLYPLPGTTYRFGFFKVGTMLTLQVFDGNKLIAYMDLEKVNHRVLPNSWQVDVITTDESYRGKGIASAVYRVILKSLKITLLAGHAQTPGGRLSWLKLVNMPGVEVKGLIVLDDNSLPPTTPDHKMRGYEVDIAQENMELLLSMGADYLGEHGGSHYFAFDVVPGTGELEPYIKNKLSTIYDGNAELFARWVG